MSLQKRNACCSGVNGSIMRFDLPYIYLLLLIVTDCLLSRWPVLVKYNCDGAVNNIFEALLDLKYQHCQTDSRKFYNIDPT